MVAAAAQAFGLPPLTPRAVHCNPAEGTIEVTYGELTSTRVFMLRAEARGRDPHLLLQPRRHANAARRRQGCADRARPCRRGVHPADRWSAATGSPESTITRLPEAVRALVLDRNGALSALAGLRHAIHSASDRAGERHDQPDRTADHRARRRSPTTTRSAMSAPMSACPAARISPSIPHAAAQAGCGRSRQGAGATTTGWCASPPTS